MTLEGIIIIAFLLIVIFSVWVIKGRQVEIVTRKYEDPLYIAAKPVKVVFVSDFHLGYYFSINSLKEHIKRINNLKPDIVILGGDYVGWGFWLINKNKLIETLRLIDTPHRLSIYGNHDYRHRKALSNIFKNAHIRELVNESINSHGVTFVGLDECQFGQPKMPIVEGFSVVLMHQPEGIKYTSPAYQLSGHSHGGQIVLPIIGRLHHSSWSHTYWRGHYETPFGAIYVSRGLGYHGLPIRLGSRPEITQITISRQESRNSDGI